MKRNENTPLNIIERINSRISLYVSILVLIAAALVLWRLDYRLVRQPKEEQKKQELQKEQEQALSQNAPSVTTASVIAVGDNLYHDSIINYGKGTNDTWNYDSIYDNVRSVVQAADIAIADQETILTADHDMVSGYPSFLTPVEAGDALVNAGFDVIECATNHVDDYGSVYIEETLNFWKTKHPDITVLGIHESQEDADTVKIREVNGIRVAFLDYTYGTNSASVSEQKPYMIDQFSQGTDRVSEMIQKAKSQADCLIFIAHWGNEDEPMPSEYEKQWANFLMQQGVDVVIGGHPHVLQPYGHLTDDEGHDMVIFYSLGNFVSSQLEMPEILEGMASFTIEKTVQGDQTSVKILDPAVRPMVMHYDTDRTVLGPYMLEDYPEELSYTHGIINEIGNVFSIYNLYRKFEEIMSINVKPSTGTDLLNIHYDWEGNMIDNTTGQIVYDNASITEYQYYGGLGINISDYLEQMEIDYTAGYSG